MERRKGGMPSKGPRREVKLRVPPHVHKALGDAAGHAGMTVNDFLTEMIERELDVIALQQLGLPLAG